MKYMVLRDGSIKDTENNLFIPKTIENRHFQAYKLWLEGKDEFGNDLGTGKNTPDIEPDITIGEAKVNKVKELKAKASVLLLETDWYIVRQMETGIPVPSEILSYRESIRNYVTKTEAKIAALASVEAVSKFTIEFP